MSQLTPGNRALPLVTGVLTAAALSGAAVFAVLQSGCDDPGSYQVRDDAVELIGGCLRPDDLPVNPRPPAGHDGNDPAMAR
ncbi:hypothetical protein SAMN02982929_03807 [Saccharopolyspora kobensis]|uniref:Uncharacterized protein n=1 Tax=Saccharopolyspora kobensis TaxID=146035 RepID=A0A1H6D1B8_9PSEU|nr:hypothetical protein [Saccharopolyspora kobensis]SEG78997.1 hypothetical protein SAMN02982929_03807 [Saccharopolyspora kobensis]SFD06915.1 hypothetical protein SAMN05216506_102402 [Saccharopolyspora kobensis]